ncbi:FAD binding domain-containing protein [Solidesulfovibrio magneticus]|uniref:Xanthine dehydrogenase FAD binding subunit n=1 Tax=Solidesulfovibrio magneticus (strain ATCC 700980 / DSM 13731 / RS-1) TaxID=573370 RepID=C4XR82_SOLM1|nr:xanthine dehydrogenase family protein subunit M [Solidesulfovibrio magneticus]BAH75427.1 xanthine dehydrogenase FAD binding subunit [Solidesulfovibrio magneticus RS-1]
MIGRVMRPDSLEALWPMLEDGARPMAGGTDLLVGLRQRQTPCDVALLEAISGLNAVGLEDGLIRLGATACHARLLAHPLVRERLPALARALSVLGSPLVRNMGTLGGNIATASPAGDTLPPLHALDAQVELASRQGIRRLPLAECILGPGRTALAPEEIVTAVLVSPPPPGALHHFEKVGRRDALAIAVASLAAVIVRDEAGCVTKARLAVGSLGPTARRCAQAEACLLGRRLDRHSLAEAGQRLREDVSPIDDLRATAAYRLRLAGNLPLRLLGL